MMLRVVFSVLLCVVLLAKVSLSASPQESERLFPSFFLFPASSSLTSRLTQRLDLFLSPSPQRLLRVHQRSLVEEQHELDGGRSMFGLVVRNHLFRWKRHRNRSQLKSTRWTDPRFNRSSLQLANPQHLLQLCQRDNPQFSWEYHLS